MPIRRLRVFISSPGDGAGPRDAPAYQSERLAAAHLASRIGPGQLDEDLSATGIRFRFARKGDGAGDCRAREPG